MYLDLYNKDEVLCKLVKRNNATFVTKECLLDRRSRG